MGRCLKCLRWKPGRCLMKVVFGMKIVVLMIVEVMEVDEMMDTMVEEGLKCDMEKSMEVVLDGDLVEVDIVHWTRQT